MCGRGVGVFVVQAFRRQECVADKEHRRQRRYGGRGVMKSDSGAVLGLMMLAGLLTAASARAEDAAAELARFRTICSPARARFPRSRKPSKAAIRWIFWWSAAGPRPSATSEASAYPARLQAALKEKLPSVAVNVSVELQVKKTAEEVAAGLVKLMEGKKPTLVIWQTGTVDAMRSVDPDDFRSRGRRRRCCAAKCRSRRDFDESAI